MTTTTRIEFYNYCTENDLGINNFWSYVSFLNIDKSDLSQDDKDELKYEFDNL